MPKCPATSTSPSAIKRAAFYVEICDQGHPFPQDALPQGSLPANLRDHRLARRRVWLVLDSQLGTKPDLPAR